MVLSFNRSFWHGVYLFVQFIQNHGANICKQNNDMEWIPVKFLIITLSLVMELQIMQERAAECGNKVQSRSESSVLESVVRLNYGEAAISFEKFPKIFLLILVLETNCTKLVNVSALYYMLSIEGTVNTDFCLACRRNWSHLQICLVPYFHSALGRRTRLCLVLWEENLEALVNAGCHLPPPLPYCKQYESFRHFTFLWFMN